MLVIVATCVLVAQTLFTVPNGWVVSELYTGGEQEMSQTVLSVYCPPECQVVKKQPYVKITRTIQEKEIVEVPKECKMAVSLRGDKQ